MPISWLSNQRCRVSHPPRPVDSRTGRRGRARVSHILRVTPLSPRTFHHCEKFGPLDVGVLQAVHDEDARGDVARLRRRGAAVVALGPESVYAPVSSPSVAAIAVVDGVAVDRLGAVALDVRRQAGRVVVGERQSLVAVVVVPGADRARSARSSSSPSTPVAATPLASVPSYYLPIRAASPLVQSAVTGLPSASTAVGAAVEPVDDGLHRADVGRGALVDAAGRAGGAGHVDRERTRSRGGRSSCRRRAGTWSGCRRRRTA